MAFVKAKSLCPTFAHNRDQVFNNKSSPIKSGIPYDEVKLEDDFLAYQATVDIFPEIEVQGLSDVDVERHIASISDDDVDTMIESLRQQRQEFVEKDDKLAQGDQATFDFVRRRSLR